MSAVHIGGKKNVRKQGVLSRRSEKVCFLLSPTKKLFSLRSRGLYVFHFTLCNSQACLKDCKWLLISKTMVRRRKENDHFLSSESRRNKIGRERSRCSARFIHVDLLLENILKMHGNGQSAYQFSFFPYRERKRRRETGQ